MFVTLHHNKSQVIKLLGLGGCVCSPASQQESSNQTPWSWWMCLFPCITTRVRYSNSLVLVDVFVPLHHKSQIIKLLGLGGCVCYPASQESGIQTPWSWWMCLFPCITRVRYSNSLVLVDVFVNLHHKSQVFKLLGLGGCVSCNMCIKQSKVILLCFTFYGFHSLQKEEENT